MLNIRALYFKRNDGDEVIKYAKCIHCTNSALCLLLGQSYKFPWHIENVNI